VPPHTFSAFWLRSSVVSRPERIDLSDSSDRRTGILSRVPRWHHSVAADILIDFKPPSIPWYWHHHPNRMSVTSRSGKRRVTP
jgi:hypothetical protein